MLTISFRAIDWTFRRRPLQRFKGSASDKDVRPIPGTLSDLHDLFMDSIELAFNLRGHDWCWGKGLHTPPETRPTHSTPAFLATVSSSALTHWLLCDTLHYTVQSFSPTTFGSPIGGSIIDESLPPLQRYSRSTMITILSGFTIYTAIQTVYDITTLVGVLIFQQRPSQWPPVFHAPWRSTSLADFWSRRWHQVFRRCFVSLGFEPFSFLLGGKAPGVLGAFFISGILHDLGMWGMGRGTNPWAVTGFFLMMAVGIIFEGIFKKVTGERVRGWGGYIWTMCWVLAWATMLVDAWARIGLMGSMFVPARVRPATNIVLPVVNGILSHYYRASKTLAII
jgi:hypothetical protein